MIIEKRNYYLVKYAPGSYMGKQHQILKEAEEHIAELKGEGKPYSERNYTISHFVETEEEIKAG